MTPMDKSVEVSFSDQVRLSQDRPPGSIDFQEYLSHLPDLVIAYRNGGMHHTGTPTDPEAPLAPQAGDLVVAT